MHTLYVTNNERHQWHLANQLLNKDRTRRYDDGETMVVAPYEALTGHRFERIFVTEGFLRTVSEAEAERRQDWFVQAVALKLVPGGKLIWM